jgi:thiopeptide-type bacteriocin biosynthesis protein
VHPPVRGRALALAGWPDGPAVTPAALSLALYPSGLAVRDGAGTALRSSPLHRVRSATAPAGLYRLLAGWSLCRQHAPWALAWGALADLPRLPRVRLDGFVIAPASWRIPPRAALARRGGLRAWRAAAGLPGRVQVGEGDELLPVDLDAPDAREDLARHAGGRAFEVWPPLERLADRGGRRVEAVVAVVCAPGARPSAPPPGTVPPPARRPPDPTWATFKLFGAEERQDQVLLAGVAPLVAAARAAGEIDRWHFLRYVDPPGGRDHLRLRVHAASPRSARAFDGRLRETLAPLRESGDLVAVEVAEYFPETARYGGPAALSAAVRLFELDSELVLRLLATEAEAAPPPESDRIERLVRAFDALGRGLGLELEARQGLARRRRLAAGPADVDAEFRRRQRRLAAALSVGHDDPFSAALDGHATRVRALLGEERAPIEAIVAVLAPVLHVSAVRHLGARPADEAAAYAFWERTLEGQAARRRRSG